MENMLDKLSKEIPKDVDRFVNKSFDIADRIDFLLKEKNITQKELAKKLEKKESEISKWLQGTHNFTLKTITKIEVVLGEEIIISCGKHEAGLEKFRKTRGLSLKNPNCPS